MPDRPQRQNEICYGRFRHNAKHKIPVCPIFADGIIVG